MVQPLMHEIRTDLAEADLSFEQAQIEMARRCIFSQNGQTRS